MWTISSDLTTNMSCWPRAVLSMVGIILMISAILAVLVFPLPVLSSSYGLGHDILIA